MKFLMIVLLFCLPCLVLAQMPAVILPNDQRVEVLGMEPKALPTSCRMYRKRVEMYLQRIDEAYLATAVNQGSMSAHEVRRLIDLTQRSEVPLYLGNEDIVWRVQFVMSEEARGATQYQQVGLESPYLKWTAGAEAFPDHFQVDVNAEQGVVAVTYRMTYMEACLAPIGFQLRLVVGEGEEVILVAHFLAFSDDKS